MRHNLFILILFFLSTEQLMGQSALTVDFGQNFTNFKYTDAQGNENDSFESNFSNSLNVGYSYYLKQGIFFSSKIGYRKAGASYVFDDFNYKWNLNYTDFKLGIGYERDLGPLYAHFSVQGYAGYLFKAEQILHNTERDMLEDETLEEWDFGLFFTPGVSYAINEKVHIGLDFNYMLGLSNIETDKNQETFNTLMGSSVNLIIKL
jgi:outer membrane protein W